MPTKLNPAAFAGRRVLVVGEAILDRYIEGSVERISREAPVPVLTNTNEFRRCGGAANAAANITALGSAATLVSPCGDDAAASRLADCCAQAGIATSFVEVAGGSTVEKQRIMSQGQQLLRVDTQTDQSGCAAELADTAAALLEQHDVVVVSDYGLDALTQAPRLIDAAAGAGKPVVVDPRSTDWSRYAGASLVTPNLAEFNAASAHLDMPLDDRARQLLATHRLGAILLTTGAAGMTLYRPDAEPVQLPTHVLDVYDVTGAGDTVIALMALGLAADADLADAAHWANIGAGVVVGKLGAATVRPAELTMPLASRGGTVVSQEELLQALDKERGAGKRIALTNGCFDILHIGHLASLSTAARQGDILVVAVNDDESVRTLKGDSRPIVPLAQRMALLAGLGCVDYVVSFAGADAIDLVAEARPDVYVKGGDWEEKEAPEAATVKQYGGEVVYIGIENDTSTTKIINEIGDRNS